MSVQTLTQDVIPGVLTGGLYNLGKAGFNVLTAPAQRQLRAQKELEQQRRDQLSAQDAARNKATATAAVRGQNFGTRSSFLGSFGFGTGTTNAGGGNLFGN